MSSRVRTRRGNHEASPWGPTAGRPRGRWAFRPDLDTRPWYDMSCPKRSGGRACLSRQEDGVSDATVLDTAPRPLAYDNQGRDSPESDTDHGCIADRPPRTPGGPDLPQERRVVTAIPGPRSVELLGPQEVSGLRRRRHRPAGLRHGRRWRSRRRRRRQLPDRPRRRHRRRQRRQRRPRGGRRRPGAGRRVHPHLLHGHAVRGLRRGRRAAQPADPRRPRQEDRAVQLRRRGRRERGEDRPVRDRRTGRRRVRARATTAAPT